MPFVSNTKDKTTQDAPTNITHTNHTSTLFLLLIFSYSLKPKVSKFRQSSP